MNARSPFGKTFDAEQLSAEEGEAIVELLMLNRLNDAVIAAQIQLNQHKQEFPEYLVHFDKFIQNRRRALAETVTGVGVLYAACAFGAGTQQIYFRAKRNVA